MFVMLSSFKLWRQPWNVSRCLHFEFLKFLHLARIAWSLSQIRSQVKISTNNSTESILDKQFYIIAKSQLTSNRS